MSVAQARRVRVRRCRAPAQRSRRPPGARVWHVTHREHNRLMHALHGNGAATQLLQTPAAARERLRLRATRFDLEFADMRPDGNCFYRAIACILVDLGLCSGGYGHSDVRTELADTLDKHQVDRLGNGLTLANAALLASHDWQRPDDLAEDAAWPPTEIHQAAVASRLACVAWVPCHSHRTHPVHPHEKVDGFPVTRTDPTPSTLMRRCWCASVAIASGAMTSRWCSPRSRTA